MSKKDVQAVQFVQHVQSPEQVEHDEQGILFTPVHGVHISIA